MVYSSNIPQPTDNPSDSQGLILDNFTAIANAFNLNHGDFDDSSQGKHKFLQMPEQGSAPATSADEGALYTKEVTFPDASKTTQLFWENEGSGTEQQFTNTFPSSSGNHYSWNFSDGLQFRFGTVLQADPQLVTFETVFSKAAYTVFITPIGAGANTPNYNVQGLGVSNFTIFPSGRAGSFYYVAIGR